jgi:hypothetical protein
MADKEVVVAEAQDLAVRETTPMELIARLAGQEGFDPEKLEKLMDLQERWEDRQAKRAFNDAMAKFQADAPRISKTKKGGHDILYAPLDDIMATIQPALTSNGLAVRFSTEFIDRETIKATCYVSHSAGHTEASEIVVPIDSKQVANSSQKIGSANSYAKRYALSNGLNLAFTEGDDDAYGLYETISEDQATVIRDLLEETQSDVPAFLKYAGAAKVDDISTARYDQLVHMLERKRA